MKSLNKSEDDFLLQITEKAYERESDENRFVRKSTLRSSNRDNLAI